MIKIRCGTLRSKVLFIMLCFAVLLVSLSLFVSSEQPILQKQDYLTLISNTPHCLDNCETVYRLCPNGASDNTFDLEFKEKSGQKQKGLTSQKSLKIELQGNGFHVKELVLDYKKPVAVDVPLYIPCQQNITRLNNLTQQEEVVSYETTCNAGKTTEWREGTAWEKFTPGKIKDTQTCFPLRVRGTINWGDYVDNIISFAGYTYDEYAEWNGDVLQHTLTADFAGNGTNTTTSNDKISLLSSSGGVASRSVYETFENNSIVQYTSVEGGADAKCEIVSGAGVNINGTYGLRMPGEGGPADRGCTRRPFDYSRNNEPFNATFTFNATTTDAGWAYVGMATSNSSGGATPSTVAMENSIGSAFTINGVSSGLTCASDAKCDIILEYLPNGGNVDVNLYVNGAKGATLSNIGTSIGSLDYFRLRSNSASSQIIIDDLEIYNKTDSTPLATYSQGNYYSQKIDTGTENESIRINVSTNNVSAVKFETRVSNTSAGLDALDWTAFIHNTDLSTKGRWLQYRFNFTHDLSEVTEVNVSRRFDALGNEQGDEANVRAAIDTTVSAHLSGYTLYTAQQVYLRNASGAQAGGAFDKVVSWQNKRWLFNYLAGSDAAIGAFNITPVVYSLEMQNLTTSQIQQRVGQLINATK